MTKPHFLTATGWKLHLNFILFTLERLSESGPPPSAHRLPTVLAEGDVYWFGISSGPAAPSCVNQQWSVKWVVLSATGPGLLGIQDPLSSILHHSSSICITYHAEMKGGEHQYEGRDIRKETSHGKRERLLEKWQKGVMPSSLLCSASNFPASIYATSAVLAFCTVNGDDLSTHTCRTPDCSAALQVNHPFRVCHAHFKSTVAPWKHLSASTPTDSMCTQH